MNKIFLGNLKTHDITDSSCPFYVEGIEGLESAEISTSQFPKSGMNGIYVTNQFLRGRRIALKGGISTDNNQELITYRRQLLAECMPSKTNTILNDKVLSFETLDGSQYRIRVQVLGVKCPLNNNTSAEFLIDMIALDDSISSETSHIETIQTMAGGGHTVPYILPVSFDGGSGGSAIIKNSGDFESYPTIKLFGPLTNPRVENRTTGKWLALTLEIASGSYVEADMANRTIIQGDLTNRIGAKTDDSRFWALADGDNEIVLTSSISGEAGYCQITFRDQWSGI